MLNNNKVNKVMENGFNEKMYKLLEKANGKLMTKEWLRLVVDLHYNTNDNIQVRNVYECTCNMDKRNVGIIEYMENGKMFVHILLCNANEGFVDVYLINGNEKVCLHRIKLLHEAKDVKDLYVPINERIEGEHHNNIIQAVYNRKADKCLIYKFEEKKEINNDKCGGDVDMNNLDNNIVENVVMNNFVDRMMNNEIMCKVMNGQENDIKDVTIEDLEIVLNIFKEANDNPIIKFMMGEEAISDITKAANIINGLKEAMNEDKPEDKPIIPVCVLNEEPKINNHNKLDNYVMKKVKDLNVLRRPHNLEYEEEVKEFEANMLDKDGKLDWDYILNY